MLKTFAHFDFRMAKLQIINHKQRHLKNFGMRYPKGVKLIAKTLANGFPATFQAAFQAAFQKDEIMEFINPAYICFHYGNQINFEQAAGPLHYQAATGMDREKC
jgi:hypothetical protein